MSFNIIPIIIIIASLVGIAIIIIRRFPDLAALDVESIPERREEKLKEKIIIERVQRRLKKLGELIASLFTPIMEFGKKRVEKAYEKVVEIEKNYQKEIEESKPAPPGQHEANRLQFLLQEAKKATDAEDFKDAEQALIEALQYDNKNIEIYKGLANVYEETKEYQQAEETIKYLIRLVHTKVKEIQDQISSLDQTKDLKAIEEMKLKISSLLSQIATYHRDLGEIYEEQQQLDEAASQYHKAVQLDPNNPRYLDFWLKVSILRGDQSRAEEALERLKEVDPDNKKLTELTKQVAELGGQE